MGSNDIGQCKLNLHVMTKVCACLSRDNSPHFPLHKVTSICSIITLSVFTIVKTNNNQKPIKLSNSIDLCLLARFMGLNAQQTISTDRLWAGRNLVCSLCSLTIPAKRSTLGARLSLISLHSIAKSRLSLDRFFGPHRHIKGETPIPVFA